MFIGSIFLLLIAYGFFYSIVYCVAKAINCGDNLTLINAIMLSCHVTISSSYLPIPGATGGVEYAFSRYFSIVVSGFAKNALLLIWRFVTYYLPTLIGGLVFNFKTLKKK